MVISSSAALALTLMSPILVSAAPQGDFFNTFLGGASDTFLGGGGSAGAGVHQHNAASPDVVCRAFLDRMEAIRRSNAMTCKDFLDPKLIPEDVRAFCKFSGIEALRGCRFGVECINSYLRTTAISPSLGACVCHSFTEAFLSLYSQAYLFCPADGSGRQERLFQIPSKLIEIGFSFSKDSIKGFTFGTDFEFNVGGSGDYDKYGDDDDSEDD